ncbi:MAG: hypothetical protein PHF84_12885 [bacterium]|nr:hypothetical protein [bacterium]
MEKSKRYRMAGILLLVFLIPFLLYSGQQEQKIKKVKTIIVNNFEKGSIWNSLENRSGAFQKEPSYCFVDLGENKPGSRYIETSGHYLILDYAKKTEGGPGNEGGWCGWYTLLKTDDNIYLNLTGYNYIRFYFKPVNGNEDFIVGMADKKWDLIEDSVKLQNPVKDYVTKKFKSGWLEVIIPFSDFEDLCLDRMSSFAIVFEPGKGTLYMDNITIGYDPKYDSSTY